jgi:hypothetical protein
MFREAAVAALSLATATAFKLDALQKRDGVHGDSHAHPVADSSGGYGAPAASYQEPEASYGAPAASYGAPSDGYGASVGYEEEAGLPDLTPIIVGILVLTGLSLLFPTFVSLSSVRRKRHAEDGKTKTTLVDGKGKKKLPTPPPIKKVVSSLMIGLAARLGIVCT